METYYMIILESHPLDTRLQAYVSGEEAEKPGEILEENQEKDRYKDTEFPPKDESISPDTDSSGIKWCHPREFLSSNNIALFNNVQAADIKQGNLADCYFLSALCVLTEKQKIIMRLFHRSNDNSIELFSIWLNDSGEWRIFCLDQFFPCAGVKAEPVFARPAGTELWVMLIEKAYAKMFGSYKVIEYGFSTLALRDITGAPYETYICEDVDQCWSYLKDVLHKKKWLVTANSRVRQKSLKGLKNSLAEMEPEQPISQHCYAVVDLMEIPQDYGRKIRAIKLNNPWRTEVGMNGWEPDSAKWPLKTRQDLGIGSTYDKGVFWVSAEQFIKEFSTGACCKIFDNYLYTSLKLWQEDDDTESCIFMKVDKQCHLFIGISQKDERHFKYKNRGGNEDNPDNEEYKYSPVKLIVSIINDQQEIVQTKGGVYNDERDGFVEAYFEPGIYLIYVQFDWCQDFYRDFVISTYGSCRAILTEVVLDGEKPIFTEQMMLKAAGVGLTSENSTIQSYDYLGEPLAKRVIGILHGFLVFYYKNESKDKALREKVEMTLLNNLQIQHPYTNNKEFELEVLPGTERVVLYKITQEEGLEYQYKFWAQMHAHYDNPKDLKQFIIDSAKKVNQKKIQEKAMPVWVYTCPQPSRVYFLWKNDSDLAFDEKITFELKNLVPLSGEETNQFSIFLRPQSEHILVLKARDISQGISFTYSVNFKFRKYIPKGDESPQIQPQKSSTQNKTKFTTLQINDPGDYNAKSQEFKIMNVKADSPHQVQHQVPTVTSQSVISPVLRQIADKYKKGIFEDHENNI